MQADGALVVDIRPAAQRAAEGELGFGLIVERNVLEWRFDLTGSHTLPEVISYDQPVVVVCSEGYASSLAADSLRQLGFARAADLAGGYQAWRLESQPLHFGYPFRSAGHRIFAQPHRCRARVTGPAAEDDFRAGLAGNCVHHAE